jgi:hypothetical protein
MKIKNGASIAGLHLLMRPVLIEANRIYKLNNRELVVTSGLDGIHSAGSYHYYGLALDFRTRDLPDPGKVAKELKMALPYYDVILESTHLHVEPDNNLLAKHGLLFT